MSNQIEIICTLKGNNEIYARDRGRVLNGAGICISLRSTDYKDPPKVLVEVKHEKNKD